MINLKKLLLRVRAFSLGIGIEPVKFFYFIKELPFYLKDILVLKKQLKLNKDFKIRSLYPILDERTSKCADIANHYFQQDLLVARLIYKHHPKKHVDIGSSLYGFVSHVASFREIEVFDIRPQVNRIRGIIFTQTDMMYMPPNLVEYCDSISSLHAIEHFGLGRYGDRIDANGHLKGLDNIYIILKKGGKFYFSAPIGRQRIVFNAHRVFSIEYLLGIFKDRYKIDSFSFVDDRGNLHENFQMDDVEIGNNFNSDYCCGIFEMTKL